MAPASAAPAAPRVAAESELPGHGGSGPTLEISEYNRKEQPIGTAVNRPGFAHIAFAVDNVARARELVLAAGGGQVGAVTTRQIPGAGTITTCARLRPVHERDQVAADQYESQ